MQNPKRNIPDFISQHIILKSGCWNSLGCVRAVHSNAGLWLAENEHLMILRHTLFGKCPTTTYVVSGGKNPRTEKEVGVCETGINHGPGWLLEAVILVLLPISSGDGAVHAGAMGEDGVQYLLTCEITLHGWTSELMC